MADKLSALQELSLSEDLKAAHSWGEKPLCTEWVWTSESNAHIAKERGWFSSYLSFESVVQLLSITDKRTKNKRELVVFGVGTVEIPVKVEGSRKGRKSPHRVLTLNNVLHVPGNVCNIIAADQCREQMQGQLNGETLCDKLGAIIARRDNTKHLWCLKLSGPPVGPHSRPSKLDKTQVEGPKYDFCIHWPKPERLRHRMYSELRNKYGIKEAPYSLEEKEWIRRKYGNEGRFLHDRNLKLTNEQDRDFGRLLIRGFMSGHLTDGDFCRAKAPVSKENKVSTAAAKEKGTGTESSKALDVASFFTEAQRAYMAKDGRSPVDWMKVVGLDATNRDDVKIAVEVAQRAMEANARREANNGIKGIEGAEVVTEVESEIDSEADTEGAAASDASLD